MKYVDIVLVKQQIDNGKLKTSIDALGNIYLEDTYAGEAVNIGKLPSTYSFHKQGKWYPYFSYTSRSIDQPLQGKPCWSCSECGWNTDERYDWCTCGADMRASKKPSTELLELLEEL